MVTGQGSVHDQCAGSAPESPYSFAHNKTPDNIRNKSAESASPIGVKFQQQFLYNPAMHQQCTPPRPATTVHGGQPVHDPPLYKVSYESTLGEPMVCLGPRGVIGSL